MNTYLIPANTKKSTLIMGFLRIPDAIILASGVVTTVLLLLLFGNNGSNWMLIVVCLPAAICGLLVVPIANYHNVLVGIQSVLRYYRERRNYVWRGWCIYDEFKDTK